MQFKKLIPLAASLLLLASCGGTLPSKPVVESESTKTKTSRTSRQKPTFDVTFDLNYDGAPEASVVKVEEKTAVAAPADPVREGYYFAGWRVGADSQEDYVFEHRVNQNMTLYAAWGKEGVAAQKQYTLEAEYCPCITDGQGMTGATWSGGANGKGLIQEVDDPTIGASGDFYVHLLYEYGNNLVFDIMSDKAAENVTLKMRLSLEYRNELTINPGKYAVKHNGTALQYAEITLTDDDLTTTLPFEDFLVTANLSLVEGLNKFEMITDNTEVMKDTAKCQAPMVDCLKVITPDNVKLTWPTAKPSNIIEDGE